MSTHWPGCCLTPLAGAQAEFFGPPSVLGGLQMQGDWFMSLWSSDETEQQTPGRRGDLDKSEAGETKPGVWSASRSHSSRPPPVAGEQQDTPARGPHHPHLPASKHSSVETARSVDYALLYGDGPMENLLPRLTDPGSHQPGKDHTPNHGGGGGGGGGSGGGNPGNGGSGTGDPSGGGASGEGGDDSAPSGPPTGAVGSAGSGAPAGGPPAVPPGGGEGGEHRAGSTPTTPGSEGDRSHSAPVGSSAGAPKQSAAAAPAPLQAAETAKATFDQFSAATPTVQAHSYQSLGGQLTAALGKEECALSKAIPELTAKLEDESGDHKDSLPIQVPSHQSTLDTTPQPVQKAPLPAKTDLGKANRPAAPQLTQDAQGKVSQQQVAQGLRGIRAHDSEIPVSPSPKPALKATGSNDPKQAEQKQKQATSEVESKLATSLAAIHKGPGPEKVQPLKLEEKHKVDLQHKSQAYETVALDGHKKFIALGLPADVQASFDELHAAKMTASLAAARAKMDAAHNERDQRRDAEIKGVEQKVQQQNKEAQHKQGEAVQAGRTSIQKEREQTEAKYKAERDKFVTDSQKKSEGASRAIKTRIDQDQRQIDHSFQKAESDAQQHVEEGERKASAAKKKSEDDSKNQSWWDRAVGFIKDAISALTSLISDIFDAVRKAVAKVLDAAKELACKLIDAACAFVQEALTILGEALKTMVSTLIGGIFPELAQRLCDAIDKTVAQAKAAVQKIGDDLKQKVCALIDEFKSAIDGILSFFQSAVTTVLSIAKAVMSGDWKEVVKLALEAALKLAGIDPEEFYATVGNVETVLSAIVQNPGAFIGNLIQAGVQGFRQFGQNFGKHLQSGFVSWLTGVSGEAGIPMPIEMSPQGIFSLITGVLDLNWTSLKGMLTESIRKKGVAGEKVAQKLSQAELLATKVEAIWHKVQELASGGWAGLWQYVADYVGGLTDTVIGSVKDFLMQRVVMAAISKLATMWNPVGAIVQALITAWNMYQWFKENMQRIMGVVRAVFGAVGQIVQGNLSGAANGVEKALGGLVAPAIDLLASILGLSGLGGQVRGVISQVRTQVHGLLQKVSDKLVNTFWSLAEKALSKLRGDKTDSHASKEEHSPEPAQSARDQHSAHDPAAPSTTPKPQGTDPAATPQTPKPEGEQQSSPSLGAHLSFHAGNESHELWFEGDAQDPVLMVASDNPGPVQKKLGYWKQQLKTSTAPDGEKDRIRELIRQAGHLRGVAIAAAKKPNNQSRIQAAQQDLVRNLISLFKYFDDPNYQEINSEKDHIHKGDFNGENRHTGGGHSDDNFSELKSNGYTEIDANIAKTLSADEEKYQRQVKLYNQYIANLKNYNNKKKAASKSGVVCTDPPPVKVTKPNPTEFGLPANYKLLRKQKLYYQETNTDGNSLVGGITDSKEKIHRDGHTWFPRDWSQTSIEHISHTIETCSMNKSQDSPGAITYHCYVKVDKQGLIMFSNDPRPGYTKVKVIRTIGGTATVFPEMNQ